MNNVKAIKPILAAAVVCLTASYAHAQEFSAQLSGFNEVPAAIFSPGSGTITLNLNQQAGTLDYKLSYADPTTPVTQAHIHFGKPGVAGGVIAFLCSNLPNPPAGTQACPEAGGTVSGTISADRVVGIDAQNFPAGDFSALVAALTSNTTYANVHTTKFPMGELRGDIRMPGATTENLPGGR